MYQRYFFLPSKKITIIPNGLDTQKYHLDEEVRAKKRAELGITNNLVLGCLAKLRAQKGHTYLLQGFQDIRKKHPETRLLLIGDGEERRNLEDLAKNLHIQDAVIFLGNRNDIPELLSALDIFVFPTLFEGMSNALMEAMASSLPIIATDIPENRELLIHNTNALLVSSGSSEAILEATESLLNDTERKSLLAKNARITALQRFDLTEILGRYRELLKK